MKYRIWTRDVIIKTLKPMFELLRSKYSVELVFWVYKEAHTNYKRDILLHGLEEVFI